LIPIRRHVLKGHAEGVGLTRLQWRGTIRKGMSGFSQHDLVESIHKIQFHIQAANQLRTLVRYGAIQVSYVSPRKLAAALIRKSEKTSDTR
jgi:hypothetical protein